MGVSWASWEETHQDSTSDVNPLAEGGPRGAWKKGREAGKGAGLVVGFKSATTVSG